MQALILIEFVLFFLLFLYLKRLWGRKNLPPGPIPLPIVGNLIDLYFADKKFPHLAFGNLAKKYGDVMSFQLGTHDFIVVSSLESMNAILPREETGERYEFQFVFDRSFNKSLGMIWSNGDQWKEIRRFTLRKLRDFGLGKRDQMDEIVRYEVGVVVNKMKDEILRQEMRNGAGSGGVIHMNCYFALSIVNCLWKMVAGNVEGNSFGLDDKTAQKMIEYNFETVDAIALNKVCITIPFLGYLFPGPTGRARQLKVFKELQDFMRELVIERKARKGRIEDPQGFIDLFLREMETNKESSYYTEEELIISLKDLFLGGSETSSHTLSFALLYLCLNPDVQEKVQQEIALVVPNDTEPSLFDLPRMPYTQATLMEISRCGNVIPLPAARRITKDFYYNGYLMPKGAGIAFNYHPVFQSKELWGDPEKFRPERFLDDNNRLINLEKFQLFGYGKRFCMGEGLARTTIFHYVTGLMKNFNFEPVPGKPPSLEVRPGSHTIAPYPFDVLVKIRK